MRFALPTDRSKPKVVAKSPTVPTQKDPGHRYGRGMVLPGASMKGSHVVEIKVQGTTRHSSTSPHREEREDPSTFNDSYYSRKSRSRSLSPSSTGSTDLTVTTNRSQYSSASMHLSSTKPFEKPERKNRAYNLKGPLPETSNKVSLNNEGLSVNAEVISVSNTAYPPSTSGGASVRSSSSRSRSNSPAKSVASGNASVASAASRSSRSSRSSHASVTSYRSNYSKYTNTLTLSSLNDMTTSSLYQSLANNHAAYTSSGSAIHNLQLSQHAYKHIRKSQVRGAIAQFLQEEEDYASLPPGPVNVFSTASAAGSAAGRPPAHSAHASYLTSGQTVASSASDRLRANHKKQLYVQKVIDNLRASIWTELETFQDASPATLCFPSHNLHMEALQACRTDLYHTVMTWQVTYVRDIVGLLDRRFVQYAAVQRAKARLLARHQDADTRRAQLFARRADLQHTLQSLRHQAEDRGLPVDRLLARFPEDWFLPAGDVQGGGGLGGGGLGGGGLGGGGLGGGGLGGGEADGLEGDPRSLRSFLETSVFLSPDRLAGAPGGGEAWGEDDEGEGEGDGEGDGEEAWGEDDDCDYDYEGEHLHLQHLQQQQQAGPRPAEPLASSTPAGPIDRFAVDFHALRLLSASSAEASSVAPSESLAEPPPPPPPPPSPSPPVAAGRLVCYNIAPEDVDWPSQAQTKTRGRRVSGTLPRPASASTSASASVQRQASPERGGEAAGALRPLSPGASLAAAHKIDLHYLAYAKDPRPASPAASPAASPQSSTRKYALYISGDARSVSSATSAATGPGPGPGPGTEMSSPLKVMTPKKRPQPPASLSDFS